MKRRSLLASAGLAAFAGCSNNSESASTPTPTPTTSASGSAEFELQGSGTPKEVQLNEPVVPSIGIKNVGTAEGTFNSVLETKVGDREWRQRTTIEMSLAAGETGEWRSPQFTAQYLTTLRYRLDAFDETWSLEVTPRELDFGSYYRVPTGLIINILGGSFESEYPTETNETTTTTPRSAPDDETWAIMRVDVRNQLEEQPLETPEASSFVVEINGEEQPQNQAVSDEPYEASELGGRGVMRGDLVYAVPEGTQARDLKLIWEQSLPDGDVKSIWTK